MATDPKANKLSPFYTPSLDPTVFRYVWPMVCRCDWKVQQNNSPVLDTTRHMWVCSVCRKPSLYNQDYVYPCEWCGKRLVVWIYDRTNLPESCRECGGSNTALPNEVTKDFASEYERKLHEELT